MLTRAARLVLALSSLVAIVCVVRATATGNWPDGALGVLGWGAAYLLTFTTFACCVQAEAERWGR